MPKDQYLEDAVRELNETNWRNVEEFLDPWGWQQVTLVHLASYRGDTEMLERAGTLYANRITVAFTHVGDTYKKNESFLAVDKLGRCALHYAASEGHSDVVNWILDKWTSDHSTPHLQVAINPTK